MITSDRIRRIALVYDQERPETTGTYVRLALERCVEKGELDVVTHFVPGEIERLKDSEFDLCLVVDDGLEYALPRCKKPVVYWAIDTHINFERSLRRAREADIVFAAQKDGAERLRQAGVATARWLPLACDSKIHGGITVPKVRDVCFVGNLFTGPRADLVRLLQQYFPNMFVGNAYFEDMARIYSASRAVFNRSLLNDINMRVFEALASGSLLITNDLSENGQHELFRDGVHLVTYTCGQELLDKLQYYLRRDDLRERIGAAGRAEVLGKHTYDDRVREMLKSAIGCPLLDSGDKGGEARKTKGMRAGDDSISSVRPSDQSHDPSYFDHPRGDILRLISHTARTMCEVGCGHGRLGMMVKERQTCEVIGFELNEAAAAVARTRLDRVLTGDFEQMEIDSYDDYFDVVTLGDVLEHFADPAEQLARIRPWIKPGGVLIASIPNVRHHSVVRSLLDGNWTYEEAGLLDATHRNFFCRRNIERQFTEADYTISSWTAVPGPGYDEWQRGGSSGRVTIGKFHLDMPIGETQEFFVYQWLVVAAPNARRDRSRITARCERKNGRDQEVGGEHGADRPDAEGGCTARARVTSGASVASRRSAIGKPRSLPPCVLLMVTFNRLEYTKLSLDAILALNYPNLQIVIWDNASTDGTQSYLAERVRGETRVRLILSPVNRGVVYPMNSVWGADHGAELLGKVDNDTLVPPDLLQQLAPFHLASDRFGVVSGFHFRQEGEALVDESHVEEIDGLRFVRQDFVGGCAVMMRKAVLDRLGPISCRTDTRQGPFMDSGWTYYQQRMAEAGMIHGYPWDPPLRVEHMEDTRSTYCIRTPEHQSYKLALRGTNLEEFTDELCVWRPHWQTNQGGAQMLACSKQSATGNRHRMCFTHDFRRDLEQFDFFGPSFAFARFADGERAVCTGQPIQGADGWNYTGGSSPFREALLAALRFNDPDYYLGLSDGCCDRPAKEWYLGQINVPLSQVTFSNVFVNANYRRFVSQLDLRRFTVVAPHGGDYWVPEDVMNSDFDINRLVERLLSVRRPILVSAGPAACIIVHRYWQRATPQKRQTIVDVGSAIDELTKGRKTRQYQVPGTRNAELVCTW